MTHRAPDPLRLEVHSSLRAVPPDAWDRLCPPGDPFSTHAFLLALEESGSAVAETGWRARHLLLWAGEALVGAAPLYEKTHSYGEYIFDWGWAQACQRAGVRYYPKLVCAVPFTPATGGRLLVAPGPDAQNYEDALMQAMLQVEQQIGAHSLHLLFVTEPVHARLAGQRGLRGRMTMQFHWENIDEDGSPHASFEAWIGRFRAKLRKEARRERGRVAAVGGVLKVLRGAEIDGRAWSALRDFYLDTVEKRGGESYLTESFFHIAAERLQHLSLAVLVEVDGVYVAGALCFERGGQLYGRYWGCLPGYEALHFEVCYHKPIELCIEAGWTRFEAGAQGNHKLRRGLMPAPTWSLHQLRHPGLDRAVGEALLQEEAELRAHLPLVAIHGPFHRDGGEAPPAPEPAPIEL
jgi:predicted N-acyltransferase